MNKASPRARVRGRYKNYPKGGGGGGGELLVDRTLDGAVEIELAPNEVALVRE